LGAAREGGELVLPFDRRGLLLDEGPCAPRGRVVVRLLLAERGARVRGGAPLRLVLEDGRHRGAAADPEQDALHLACEARERAASGGAVDRDEGGLELLDERGQAVARLAPCGGGERRGPGAARLEELREELAHARLGAAGRLVPL